MVVRTLSPSEAEKWIREGRGVWAGKDDHKAIQRDLYVEMAKRLVFVTSIGKWYFRDSGIEKAGMADYTAQRWVDSEKELRSSVAILNRRPSDVVTVKYETPKLRDITDMMALRDEKSTPAREKRRLSQELSIVENCIVAYIDTAPGKQKVFVNEDGKRVFNLWTEPSIYPTKEINYKEPQWFLDVVEYLFGHRTVEREWFLDWCTHLIERPGIKMPVSVLITDRVGGLGKGFIADALSHMVGRKNCKAITSDIMKSGFQSFIGGTTLAVIHELYEQGNYSFADKIKTLQSESEVYANLKYGPQERVSNFVHFLAFSNRSVPLHLGDEDRRWFVFASPATQKPEDAFGDPKWWSERWRFLRDEYGLPHKGALGSLRRWFRNRWEDMQATGRFNPHKPLSTEAKDLIVENSRSDFYRRVKDLLDEGGLPVPDNSRHLKLAVIVEAVSNAHESVFRHPGNSQVSADLEALGFKPRKLKTGNVWELPEGYKSGSSMGI